MKGKIKLRSVINNRSVKTINLMAVLFVIFTIALSGCVDNGKNNTGNETETPVADDQNSNGKEYTYGIANVESIDILVLESFPVQINVIAEGYLPDGCTEIDAINTERKENNFNITIKTKRPKDAMCTQEIENFTKTIPLEVQGLRAGNYTVNVNGVTGSFELAVDNALEEPTSPVPETAGNNRS